RGGAVLDGSGAPPRVCDVGIAEGRIAALGDLGGVEAARMIAAKGRSVTPGFIDAHTHSEFTLFADPRAESAVRQGVTTHVGGNCGYSCAPMVQPDLAPHLIFGFVPSVGVEWRSFGEYLAALERSRPAINLACLVGHAAVRAPETRPATAAEVVAMEAVLVASLDEGAVGMSTGLAYPPGNNADQEELAALCDVVARRGGLHASHVRNRDVRYESGFGE